jgi:hypothetical protein
MVPKQKVFTPGEGLPERMNEKSIGLSLEDQAKIRVSLYKYKLNYFIYTFIGSN